MNIFDIFTPKKDTFYIDEDSTIRQALEKFDFHKFSVVSILDKEGKFISTLSEGDILRSIKNDMNFDIKKAEHYKVVDINRYRSYSALHMNADIEDAVKLSLEQNFIPIVDDRGVYMGILKRKTILDCLYNKKIKLKKMK